jgi:hypothetical protein
MAVVFEENEDGTYDLTVHGRGAGYDIEPDDFKAALRRARVPPDSVIYIEDKTGYRQKLGR